MIGKSYELVPLDPESDSDVVKRWFEKDSITKYMFYGQRPQTRVSIQEWLTNDINGNNDVFTIYNGKSRENRIGLAGLYSISQTARSAELRILIGEEKFWNKGVGTEVVSVLLFYAFDRLNLNSVWLGVTDENESAIHMYKKCGFVENGKRRAALYRNGKYYDAIWLDILESEYREKFYDKHREEFGV